MNRLVLLSLLSLLSLSALAQSEICNNGRDDDFDGFIDCYDGSCANDPLCDGIFLGNDANCEAPPPVFPKFTMTLDFASPNETTNHLSRMAVGDLNRDGVPEIVTMNRYTRTLYVLNGNNGTVRHSAVVTWEPYWEIAIANLDNDTCGEIFFIGYEDPPGPNNAGVYMYAFDCQLNFLWRTAQRFPRDPINFGIADFDGDGQEEIYAKDEIYDAKTGTRIVRTTAANYAQINGGPVAVNMVGDSRLELVLGLSIYQVNLGARTADAGSLTLLASRPEYFIRDEYNATSVADYNQDGFLDVLASGSTTGHDNNTTVFFWDVQNNTLRTYSDPQPALGSDYTNGWINGTGRLNIADLDGNERMNASFVSGRFLYALDENFNLLWRVNINEETSGYTGCTLFDFNGDGKAEIVYRDERFLYIIEGTDGSIYSQQACISRTNREYPIVADVDADGSTELCVTCGFNDNDAANNFGTLSYSRYSHVRVFKSAAEPWVPARRVWNQHGYFVVNVNDDLTIPTSMQAHQLVFSSGNCTQGPNRPLNKFLNQSPFLNSEGCPTYASADIAFHVAPTIVPPQCPDLNFTVSFKITNLGDVAVTGSIPVSFYTTNPLRPGSVKLNTINVAVNQLGKGDIVSIDNAVVTGIGADSLYVVLNDAGTSVPTPIVLPNTTFFECDYDNIRAVRVVPRPVTLTALQVNGNQTCLPTANGSARAFVPTGGTENTTDYNFYWSIGTTAKPIATADYVGAVYSGLAAGTYTVYARHKTANCNSDTVQVVIDPVAGVVPDVTVTALSNQTSCSPINGRLQAVIAGGGAGYTIEWFDISLNPLGITGPIANNIAAGSYVAVISIGTCSRISAPATITGPQIPDPQGLVLSNVVDCTNPNSGSVGAEALINGVAQNPANYTFQWYNYNTVTNTQGIIIPGTGPTRSGLPVGSYQVVITDNTTGCQSTANPVAIVANTVVPTAQITQLAPQTSCDPAAPNGVLEGNALVGGVVQNPSGFTFEWFRGQNTLPANLVTTTSGVNGKILNQVAGGGTPYTLRVTTPQNCSATTDFIISENVVRPVVTLAQLTPNSICDPAKATSTYNGSLQATVTFGGNPVALPDNNYQFTWRNPANQVIAVTDNMNPVLGGLPDGNAYSIVVEKTDVRCVSDPDTEPILKTTVLPLLATSSTGSNNCDPALTPDGTATVAVTNAVPADVFVYQWHAGNTVVPANALTAANNGTQPTAINLGGPTNAPNPYTVLVTNRTSGCENTATQFVADVSQKPTFTLTPFANTICDATIAGAFDGRVEVTGVTHPALGSSTVSYRWYNAHPVTGVPGALIAGATTSILGQLDNGQYGAQVRIDALGCESEIEVREVLDNPTLVVITTNTDPSTTCAPVAPNGRAEVLTPTGANIQYQWYNGTLVDPGQLIAGETSALLGTDIQGGVNSNFTVLVTNVTNGCRNNASVNVPNASVTPTISLSVVQDNTVCDIPAIDPNGELLATVGNVGANFSINWIGGVAPAVAAGTNGERFTRLRAGAYSANVIDNTSGCQSQNDTEIINDNLTFPAVTFTVTDQTSCNALAPNGGLVALGDGTTVGRSFSWFSGVGTGTPLAGPEASTNSITNRPSQDFTVRVRINATGCTSTATRFIPETLTNPTLNFGAVTPVTSCGTNANGSAQLIVGGVSNLPNFNYTVFYVETFTGQTYPSTAADVKNPLNFDGTFTLNNATFSQPPVYGSLEPGYLTAIVVDNNTQCESLVRTVQIDDGTDDYAITINGKSQAGFCGGTGGGIAVTVDRAGSPCNTCTYEWFNATPTNTNPINFFNNPPNMGAATPLALVSGPNGEDLGSPGAPPGVGAGTYTLVVTDNDPSHLGCGNYFIESVEFLNPPVVTITPVQPTTCGAPFNGEVQVDVTGPSVDGYSIQIFRGNGPSGTSVAGPFSSAVTPVSLDATLLDGGQYFVQVMDLTVINKFCPIGSVRTLTRQAYAPFVSVQVNPNTSCIPGTNADGQVSLTVTKDALDTTTPSYFLRDVSPLPQGFVLNAPPGNIIGTGASGQSTGFIPGFEPRDYTFRVLDNVSQCFTDLTVTVPDQQDLPGPLTVTPTPETACAPGSNGSALASLADPVAEFDFNWFRNADATGSVLAGGAAVQGGGATTGELLNQGKVPAPADWPMGTNGFGSGNRTYYVRGVRRVGAPSGVGCATEIKQVTILDQHVQPNLTLATTINSFCVAPNPGDLGDGSVIITADANPLLAGNQTPAGGFNYAWTNANAALVSPQNAQPNTLTIPQLGTGTYTVTATNVDNGCVVSASAEVEAAPFFIAITDTDVQHQLICLPDGQIDVVQITVDRSAAGQASDVQNNAALNALYNFEWFAATPGNTNTFVPTPLQDGTPANITQRSLVQGTGAGQYQPLVAGTYYVRATRRTTTGLAEGCQSFPVRVDVEDQHRNPVVSLTPFSNTSCAGTGEGEIEVRVTDATALPGPFSYNYDWSAGIADQSGNDGDGSDADGDGDHVRNLLTGIYTVQVTNPATGCAGAATTEVLPNATPVFIPLATATPQILCLPDGTIQVNTVSVTDRNGVTAAAPLTDFDFVWSRGTLANVVATTDGASVGGSLLDRNTYNQIGIDSYFIVARRKPASVGPGAGCESAPYRTNIVDQRLFPEITFVATANSSCSPAMPNGIVQVNAREISGVNTGPYTFGWTLNGGALAPTSTQTDTNNASVLANALDGAYLVTATNTVTGCPVTRNIQLILDPSRSTPNIIDVSAVDPLDCNPTGSAAVTRITIGSNNNSLLFPPQVPPNNEITGAGLSNYNYEWYLNSVTAGNQLPVGGPFTTTPAIGALLPGTYYVVVHDPTTDCKSGPKEVVITPDDIVLPVLNITQVMKQVSCISTAGSASLAATADGQTDANTNYLFAWFNNLTNTAPQFATTSTVANLLPGDYSVTVRDATTNCTASAPFIVEDESAEYTPIVSMGSQPRTLCVGTDGALMARVLNTDPTYPFPYTASTYTADIYFGANPNLGAAPNIANMPLAPGFINSFRELGLNEGVYTVRITDNNTGCVGVGTEEILDARDYPAMAIRELAPVTNCDPLRPNGVAEVTADGTVVGFRFEWYEGNAAVGTPVYTGSQFDQLKVAPQQYTVRATHLVSGCTSDLGTTIKDGTVPIPVPSIDILSHVTSCVLSNGALGAYVGADRNTKDFVFRWYDGTAEAASPDFVGEIYTDLAAGTYGVTATSLITGCKSPLKTEQVLDKQEYPNFDFIVQNTTCDKADGYATLILTSDVPIERIEWFNATGSFLIGPNYTDAEAGVYRVVATSFFGCETTKDVEIRADIRPFNGISRNGDGRNEFFQIDCINQFPSNLVQIFNRAGTLVYEAVGYDNSDTFFDGRSNRGLSPMGTNLPDGTYFYIIDKRDGTKPLAGYLEIVK